MKIVEFYVTPQMILYEKVETGVGLNFYPVSKDVYLPAKLETKAMSNKPNMLKCLFWNITCLLFTPNFPFKDCFSEVDSIDF